MKTYLQIKHDYLLFPVSQEAKGKRIMLLNEKGEIVLELHMLVDIIDPDCVVPYPVKQLKGKTFRIVTEPFMEFIPEQTDLVESALRRERYRPKIRFSPSYGWLNDPNGLVYANGVWHLFFQLQPFFKVPFDEAGFCSMHWGHATSNNLFHWIEQPIALYPDTLGAMFSGSAIVDFDNRLGLKQGNTETIVLFYTANGSVLKRSPSKKSVQCMAYSTDNGKTFQKYAGNPLLEEIEPENRDPKVVYNEVTDSYVMIFYAGDQKKGNFLVYVSQNLKDWKRAEDIIVNGRECPDFFPMEYREKEKWVFTTANSNYVIGEFDGHHFTQETAEQLLILGDQYAGQTWSNTGNRRIQMRVQFGGRIPGKYFNRAMSIPCELTLLEYENVPRLACQPVKEIETLYESCIIVHNPTGSYIKRLDAGAYDIQVELQCFNIGIITIALFGTKITIDFEEQTLCYGKKNEAKIQLKNGTINHQIRIVYDTTLVMLFIDEGISCMEYFDILDENLSYFSIHMDKNVEIKKLKINKLRQTCWLSN